MFELMNGNIARRDKIPFELSKFWIIEIPEQTFEAVIRFEGNQIFC